MDRTLKPPRRSSFDVPDQNDDPVVWDPQSRSFVTVPSTKPEAASPKQQWFVGSEHAGKAPPAAPRPPAAAPAAKAAAAPAARPRPKAAPPAQPVAKTKAKRRGKRIRFVPRARWFVLSFLLLPLLLGLVAWLWASSTFGKVARVEVAAVLDPVGGGGTNYLIVGSDSREAVTDAGSADPNIQPAGDEGRGQRADTMLVLRLTPAGSSLLSVPRDLCRDPCNGAGSRLNAAYSQGPAALIEAVRGALRIPIHHYLEVDFVSFSGLVDALGGITIDFPTAATDEGSGLLVPVPGPNVLTGEQALAFARSRHYEEIDADGDRHPDSTPCTEPPADGTPPPRCPFPDIQRNMRQQQFLRAVFSDLSATRNPMTLARSAGALADGLRIDDALGLGEALSFVWRMRGGLPATVLLEPGTSLVPDTVGGASILRLGPGADAVLAQFR